MRLYVAHKSAEKCCFGEYFNFFAGFVLCFWLFSGDFFVLCAAFVFRKVAEGLEKR